MKVEGVGKGQSLRARLYGWLFFENYKSRRHLAGHIVGNWSKQGCQVMCIGKNRCELFVHYRAVNSLLHFVEGEDWRFSCFCNCLFHTRSFLVSLLAYKTRPPRDLYAGLSVKLY